MNDYSQAPLGARQAIQLKNTDMCVSCGMCLPHCPTYQLARQESESPRGRLSLIRAALTRDLVIDDSMITHLDHCLLCHSCESVCPVGIPFVKIMDEMKEGIHAHKKIRPVWKRVLFSLVADRRKMQRLMRVFTGLHLARVLNLFSPIRMGGLSRYVQFATLIKKAPHWQEYYPAEGDEKHKVALFLGCLQEYFDSDSLSDAIRVLNKLGVSVTVPAEQQCCGAIHSHAGKSGTARKLFNANKNAFGIPDIDEVVSLSSACTVTLGEHVMCGSTGNADSSGKDQSALQVSDLMDYLEKIHWFENRSLGSVNKKIILHYPCTQKNSLRNTDVLDKLLSRIPELDIAKMPIGIKCCGAAGVFSLDYPDWSDKLASMALQPIDHENYDVIITSNIGCALQFRKKVRSLKRVKVLHPISLVSQSLGL